MSSSGKALSGSDLLFRDQIVAIGGDVRKINSIVVTNPRRVLNAIIHDLSDNFYPNGVENVGDLELLINNVKNFGENKVREFSEALLKRRFRRSIIELTNTPLWDKAKKFIAPYEDVFPDDLKNMTEDELYAKYKDILIKNAKIISSNKKAP